MWFNIICYVVYLVVRLMHTSYRYEYFGLDHRRKSESDSTNHAIVMATWHNNCFAGILAHNHQNFAPLMSHSRDGDLVAFICKRFGILPVRGSSSRGGKEAREKIIANLAAGFSSAITVDGPRGPVHEVKLGIVDIARRANVTVLPFAAIADRYWSLRSWDKFRIPKPFARIQVFYGEPILVPAETTKEDQLAIGNAIKESLMRLETARSK